MIDRQNYNFSNISFLRRALARRPSDRFAYSRFILAQPPFILNVTLSLTGLAHAAPSTFVTTMCVTPFLVLMFTSTSSAGLASLLRSIIYIYIYIYIYRNPIYIYNVTRKTIPFFWYQCSTINNCFMLLKTISLYDHTSYLDLY